MVYESDFYTTRRPYTRPSTYSVTTVPLRYYPTYTTKSHVVSAFYPGRWPITTQRRMLMSRASPHAVVTIRVRPSVIIRELDRIEHKTRPAIGYSAAEEFLCSNTAKDWEDEKRKIRAQTISLLQRVHAPVPRARSVVPNLYTTVAKYGYVEPIMPLRITSDDYIQRMLMPIRNVARDINSMSWYSEPAKKFTGSYYWPSDRYQITPSSFYWPGHRYQITPSSYYWPGHRYQITPSSYYWPGHRYQITPSSYYWLSDRYQITPSDRYQITPSSYYWPGHRYQIKPSSYYWPGDKYQITPSRGHLACIRYSGAKAFPNRKALCQDMSVKDDVTLLSFYARNRLAAAGLALESITAAPDLKEQPALVECS